MDTKNNRYKQFEQFMTILLLIALCSFIVFLIAAGNGTIWLAVITAIITTFISGLCLFLLYTSQLLLKPKSLWMTVAALCFLFCLLFSLIMNFPSPL